MSYVTLSSGLTLQIPTKGTRNWADTILDQTFKKISSHDHTGSGKGLQIGSSALSSNAVTTAKITADSVTDAKILLANNAYLRGRNAANSADVNIFKVNASDVIEAASSIIGVSSSASRTRLATVGQLQDRDVATCSATMSANALTGSLSPSPGGYNDGLLVEVSVSSADNTGPCTLNLNGIGAKSIVKLKNQPVGAGDIRQGCNYLFRYHASSDTFVLLGATNAGHVLNRYGVATLANSVTETDLLSEVIKANNLGAVGVIRGTVITKITNSTGVNHGATYRLKFGGTTFFTDVNANALTTGFTYKIRHDFLIANANSISVQKIYNQTIRSGQNHGIMDVITMHAGNALGTANTGSDQTLAYTMQMDVADANLSHELSFGMIEIF